MKPARVSTPDLAGRSFPVEVASLEPLTKGGRVRYLIEGLSARFDGEGFLWLDTPTSSYAVGGEGSEVMRIDPIRWVGRRSN